MSLNKSRIYSWVALLSFLGAVLALVSLYHHVELNSGLLKGRSFCDLGGVVNCDLIYRSPFAEILGIPLGSYALFFYLSLFLFAMVARNEEIVPARVSSSLLLCIATFAVLFSLYLLAIATVFVGGVCIVCLGLDLVALLIFAFSLRLSSEAGFLASFSGGLKAARAFLLGVFGRGGERPRDAVMMKAAFAGIVLCAFFSLALPDFLLMRVIIPRSRGKEMGALVNEAVAKWKGAPKQEIAIEIGSALRGDFAEGPVDAPIQVVEFSDFECGFCRSFSQVFESLMREYPDQVRLVFKNFPLDKACNPLIPQDFHKRACWAAHLARCAGEQNRFWPTASYLFQLEELESRSATLDLEKLVAETGAALELDVVGLQSCMASGRHFEKISSDIQQGAKLGVEGTPSVWVNGARVEVPNVEVLRAIFREIVAKKR